LSRIHVSLARTGAVRASFPAAGRIALLLACVLAAGGCSTVRGWFGNDDDENAKPTEPSELTEFQATASVSRLWSASAGKGEERIGARQGPAIDGGRVYAAAVEGGVRAFDLQSGAVAWTYPSELPLSGGPGAGDGVVAVGSLEGDVIALDAATGAEKWKAKVDNEVIAAPAVGQGLVIVHSNDGRVSAFDANTGERRWFWNHDQPPLTVRGSAGITLGPGFVFVGNDDGTVSALALADGRPLWQEQVAAPEGRSELDRMADVDGAPALDGAVLYASSYKGKTVAIDAPNGRVIWSSDSGGPGVVGVGSDKVSVSDRDGVVYGLDKASGGGMWQQGALARRNLTSAVVHGNYAVVGDYDGYLHWLRLDDGALAARVRAGGEALRATPAVADGVLVVQNIEGELSAYRVDQATTAQN
jgi:outer membrane protein assembly factor BamB